MRIFAWSNGVLRLAAMIVLVAAVDVSIARAVAPFTFVAIPDVQDETTYAPAMLASQVNWIINNKIAKNIAFVAQQGDLTNNGGVSQFQTAHNNLFGLSTAGIHWGTCAGNHDMDTPHGSSSVGASANYLTYFGSSNFSGKGWYGNTTSNQSSFQTFSAGGRNYLVLNLEYEADSSVLSWAQGVVSTHPNMPTIISTHEYLTPGGALSTYGGTLWNGLVKDNSQIFMILCGHYWSMTPKNMVQTNSDQKLVYTLMTDLQGLPGPTPDEYNWGNGYMRLLEFDEANSKIRASVFSPYNTTTPYITNSGARFDISLNFTARLGHAPEPSSAIMMATSATGLSVGAWLHKKHSKCRRWKSK
jgi:hypothetical protein